MFIAALLAWAPPPHVPSLFGLYAANIGKAHPPQIQPALAAGATSCPSVPCDTHSVHVLGIDVSDPSNQTALNSPYLLSLNFGQMDPARSTKVPFCTMAGAGLNYTCPKLLFAA